MAREKAMTTPRWRFVVSNRLIWGRSSVLRKPR